MLRTLIAIPLFCLLAARLLAGPTEEIESLLSYVGNLSGAKFVRNGEAHAPADAVAHMRLKWSKQKGRINTAEDFIAQCASKSTVSGKPYLIRYDDGREETAGKVLLRRLAEIRAAATEGNSRPPR